MPDVVPGREPIRMRFGGYLCSYPHYPNRSLIGFFALRRLSMDFKAAKAKLKGIANGEYFSLNRNYAEHSNGDEIEEYSIYIYSIGRFEGASWDEAFRKLEMEVVK